MGDRSSRFPFVKKSMVAGFVLVTILAAGMVPCRAVEQPGSYNHIPARRWSAEDIRALPDGPQRIERELRRQGEYSRRWNIIHDLVGKQHLSTKSRDLLRSRGLGQALLNKSAVGIQSPLGAQAQDDTLRVLIIRIGFETNRDPHLTTIDPGGDFVLEPLTDPQPLEVDPPPRNKAFFESHLQGLSEYYRFMSGGRLHIEGRVLPEESDASYKLTDVADYGPGAGNFWTLESLERLVQDIMVKADQETQADGSANLADYGDSNPFGYIIFVHAGSDWQSDVNGDSPNDIPTFFVTLGEPVNLVGTTPDGEPGKLSECSIIPETTNTDDFPGSIAAAFYHEFGHALGLPDVYSTTTGLPSVGIWDLMDSGTNLPVAMGTVVAPGDTFVIYPTGVLPPSISAWNKWFLGWLEMGEFDGRTDDYLLPPVGVLQDDYYKYPPLTQFNKGDPQAYRAGISPREWFLLENRWVPFTVGETPYDDIRFERDEATGVILYLAGQRLGGWENSGLYDFFMPPGGILVWHVNNDRIEANLPDNTINAFNDGLKLIEADGIQDIGVLESYVIGWYGSYLDPFGGSDPYGNPTGFENLYTSGFPSSRNFDRSWSGLSLSEIGPRTGFSSAVMKFKGNQGSVGKGFPYEVPPIGEIEALGSGVAPGPRGIVPESLTPVTLSNGSLQILIYADAAPADTSGNGFRATLYHRWADGLKRWTDLPGRPEGAFQHMGAPLMGAPFLQDRADGDVNLVWGTADGQVGVTHLPQFATPAAVLPLMIGDNLAGGPVPLLWQTDDHRILCPVNPNTLILLPGSGISVIDSLKISDSQGSPVDGLKLATPLPGSGDTDMVPVFSVEGLHLVRQNENGLEAEPDLFPYARSTGDLPLWTTVVQMEDGSRIFAIDAEGEMGTWSVGPDGSVTELGSVLKLDEPLVTQPAVADVDGDGFDDLVLATGKRILAFRPDGVALRGYPVRLYDLFPLPDTTRIAGPLVVADGTGDGVNEVYFNTDGGHLVGLSASGRLLPELPMRWGDSRTGALAVGGPDDARVLWLVSTGGYTGPPLDRQFVNGRVTGSGLANTQVEDSRTSEWRGSGGGSYRRGSAGTAKNLGSVAPFAAETDRVILYPNPVNSDEVTVRFYSVGSRAARISLYNLQGERVVQAEIPVTQDSINEFLLPIPGLASGLYLARLEYDAVSGIEIRTLTLAVEK